MSGEMEDHKTEVGAQLKRVVCMTEAALTFPRQLLPP